MELRTKKITVKGIINEIVRKPRKIEVVKLDKLSVTQCFFKNKSLIDVNGDIDEVFLKRVC